MRCPVRPGDSRAAAVIPEQTRLAAFALSLAPPAAARQHHRDGAMRKVSRKEFLSESLYVSSGRWFAARHAPAVPTRRAGRRPTEQGADALAGYLEADGPRN